MPIRLELVEEETAGCWLTSPLERHIENYRGNNTTDIADPFTVPTEEGQSHLSWHHYGPRKSLSSCPLKRHIESCRGTSTDITDQFTVHTQEVQSHLSWHHYGPRKSLSSCTLKRHISTRRCTTNSALFVHTQEAHQHSPLHY